MPRYFFHRTDSSFDPDREGTEFPDLATARVEAIRFAAESIRDRPDGIWEGRTFRVEVSDESDMLLCTVLILGIEAPAGHGQLEPRRATYRSGPTMP